MELLWLIGGILIGGAFAWFYFKSKSLEDGRESDNLSNKNALLEEQVEELKRDLEAERASVVELNSKVSATESDYKHLQERLNERKQELEDLQRRFALEFKNLANEIFEEKSKKFTDQNKHNISELLNPLKEKIGDFEKKVEQNSKDNLQQSAALREQLNGLKDLNRQMSKEAENLTRALKGDTKARGNWGEFILESVLEKSGLVRDREYSIQKTYTGENGRRFQPDVIVNLPENKNLVIDSKVSLIAYEKCVNAADDAEKDSNLKTHIQAIRTHLKQLSEKQYQSIYGIEKMDFVLMFIPIESAFSLAIQHDTELFTDAYERNIVIVSPSTLIATLRTIANIWRNEYQNQNALEIARQSGKLYDKFTAFTEDLLKVGRNLQQTQGSYTDAMNKLVEGKDNLIRKTQRIKELGARTTKSLDKKLIDRSAS